jgi:hypothetical protein
MRPRTTLVSLAILLAGAALCLAADMNLGTWKLDEAKSHFAPGATKFTTVVYAAEGDNVKITVDGMTSDGKPAHNEWTGKYDGKDYPVTGDPNSDARSYKKVNERTSEFAVKKDGKTTFTGRVVVAPDGKTRTVRTTETDATGKKVTSTAAYTRQ